jgi:hypothetical protein
MDALRPLPQTCLHNIAETEQAADGSLRFARVPRRLLPGLNDRVRLRAYAAAGSELRFRMPSGPVRLTLRRMPDSNEAFALPAASLVGVFHGDFQAGWYALGEGDTAITVAPQPNAADLAPFRHRYDPALVRVVLPVFPEVRLAALDGNIDAPRPGDAPSVRYLAYGSSITHGAFMPLGTSTYPAVLARELGVDGCNLGFGGGARLEPEMAEWIVSREDWSFASLELGINVLSIPSEEFRMRVRRFLMAFVADPRHRPVVCLDVFPCPGELLRSERKAAEFRGVVAEEVAALGSSRIRRVEYAAALRRVSDLSDDLLHPAAHCFEDIGRHLATELRAFPAVAALLS